MLPPVAGSGVRSRAQRAGPHTEKKGRSPSRLHERLRLELPDRPHNSWRVNPEEAPPKVGHSLLHDLPLDGALDYIPDTGSDRTPKFARRTRAKVEAYLAVKASGVSENHGGVECDQ